MFIKPLDVLTYILMRYIEAFPSVYLQKEKRLASSAWIPLRNNACCMLDAKFMQIRCAPIKHVICMHSASKNNKRCFGGVSKQTTQAASLSAPKQSTPREKLLKYHYLENRNSQEWAYINITPLFNKTKVYTVILRTIPSVCRYAYFTKNSVHGHTG